eukprot:CAMPEP_0185565118 /NCGR_PEP_ID=MMETSP1381-20130426/65449_1 /TAXON_ID=298111 /ORGANISM="Pavlova sp., Strain CCMP459" /LENGTH=373 /DNA_ID=CAMNT_0028179063 /DNA_START=135 /DNA_END=1254 /DNA_ORIENTATION=+
METTTPQLWSGQGALGINHLPGEIPAGSGKIQWPPAEGGLAIPTITGAIPRGPQHLRPRPHKRFKNEPGPTVITQYGSVPCRVRVTLGPSNKIGRRMLDRSSMASSEAISCGTSTVQIRPRRQARSALPRRPRGAGAAPAQGQAAEERHPEPRLQDIERKPSGPIVPMVPRRERSRARKTSYSEKTERMPGGMRGMSERRVGVSPVAVRVGVSAAIPHRGPQQKSGFLLWSARHWEEEARLAARRTHTATASEQAGAVPCGAESSSGIGGRHRRAPAVGGCEPRVRFSALEAACVEPPAWHDADCVHQRGALQAIMPVLRASDALASALEGVQSAALRRFAALAADELNSAEALHAGGVASFWRQELAALARG